METVNSRHKAEAKTRSRSLGPAARWRRRGEAVHLERTVGKENAVAAGQSFPHFHHQKKYKSPEENSFHLVPQNAPSLATAENKVTVKDNQT